MTVDQSVEKYAIDTSTFLVVAANKPVCHLKVLLIIAMSLILLL